MTLDYISDILTLHFISVVIISSAVTIVKIVKKDCLKMQKLSVIINQAQTNAHIHN